MQVAGTKLPRVNYDDATDLDVWRTDDGIALTLSDTNGRIYAGCKVTKEEWDAIVKHIEESFT